MVNCRECNSEVSEDAKVCPNCGAIMKPGKTVAIWALVMSFLIPIAGLILGIIATVKGAKGKYQFSLIMGIVSIVVSVISYFVSLAINTMLTEYINSMLEQTQYIIMAL